MIGRVHRGDFRKAQPQEWNILEHQVYKLARIVAYLGAGKGRNYDRISPLIRQFAAYRAVNGQAVARVYDRRAGMALGYKLNVAFKHTPEANRHHGTPAYTRRGGASMVLVAIQVGGSSFGRSLGVVAMGLVAIHAQIMADKVNGAATGYESSRNALSPTGPTEIRARNSLVEPDL